MTTLRARLRALDLSALEYYGYAVFWAVVIVIVVVFLAGCTPRTDDCPTHCEGPASVASLKSLCVNAFGSSYHVVRTCPVGLVPAACASLSDYTADSLLAVCPEEDEPHAVLCCWE